MKNNLDKLKNKKILIMGGAGFIGHNLALTLKEYGAIPSVIDGLQVNSLGYYTSHHESNPNSNLFISFINERLNLLRQAKINIEVLDLRDYHAVSRRIDAFEPDVVIHLAAIAHANRSNKDPYSTFDHSMRTLENVLDAIRGNKTHIIYFSSSMVYGNFDGEAVTEDSNCNPLGIYGALKYGAEKLVIGYNQVFDLPYTIIRPSALYGERCVSQRVGQAFIENALRGNNLTVNGDGTDALDFTYIQDLIQGVVLTITKPEARNEIFNITYGSARELNQMVDLIQQYFPNIKLENKPRDGLMPERGTLCIDKARKMLGYEPQYPLDIGFVNYIKWYQKFASENAEFFIDSRN